MLLYKYRGGDNDIFGRDIVSLENDYFWAAEISTLNDPCEALGDWDSFKLQLELAIKVLTYKKPLPSSELENLYLNLDSVIEKVKVAGIFSLSTTYNDELLWAHYGNSHKGFCIEYDTDFLLRDMNNFLYNFITVQYSKTFPKIEVSDIIYLSSKKDNIPFMTKLIGTKSLRWIYENEKRIVMDSVGKHYYDFRAVKGIYFGLRMPEEQKEMLMERLKGRGIKYFQMYLEEKSYRFKAQPVEDKFEHTPKYLYKIAKVGDCQPVTESEVKNIHKPFIPFLYKSVEVAKREPYCSTVLYAGFSYTEGTPKNPVVYVQCIRTNGEYKNYNYSLKEIDEQYCTITDLDSPAFTDLISNIWKTEN